jgi:hypothetical protein
MSITGSSSGEPSHEFGLWRREVSWEGGLSHESQRSPVVSPPAGGAGMKNGGSASSRRVAEERKLGKVETPATLQPFPCRGLRVPTQ